jgi:hypothetical protein
MFLRLLLVVSVCGLAMTAGCGFQNGAAPAGSGGGGADSPPSSGSGTTPAPAGKGGAGEDAKSKLGEGAKEKRPTVPASPAVAEPLGPDGKPLQ